MSKKRKAVTFAALRGVMGDWVYYSTLMRMDQIAQRVDFASNIHTNKKLSDMIQRELNSQRTDAIATYLNKQNERFFNSLVVATYGGSPDWHPVGAINSKDKDLKSRLDEATIETVGFLSLSGKEELFALDGQHRLAGIKKAVKEKNKDVLDDTLSVIFVGHKATPKGLAKTRRLFTTLNKTAKPVKKNEIIALDEDDVMAISVRRLIEQSGLFNDNRIAFVGGANMPPSNNESFTTIVALYDCLTHLFTKSNLMLCDTKANLTRARPSDEVLDKYYRLALRYFRYIRNEIPALDSFFSTKEYGKVTAKYRNNFGGNLVFRPKGLLIFTRVAVSLNQDMSLLQAVRTAAKLPLVLKKAPIRGLFWQSSTSRIIPSNDTLLRDILIYMAGGDLTKRAEKKLLLKYREVLDKPTAVLPDKIIQLLS